MKDQRLLKKRPFAKLNATLRFLCFPVALLAVDRSVKLWANPTGMTVGAGSATAQLIGQQLFVTTSQAAFLNWSSFNIKPGETTTFLQPSANSVVFNEIGGANPSMIFGSLNANGTVILANANGFYFGPDSMINVGGSFVATTAPLSPDFGAGSAWQFTGMPPLASIVNYGQIKVGDAKSLYLIAEQVENHGQLEAPGGDVGLYAGQSVLVSERPDGRGLSATLKLPGGSVNNYGQITASAGTIALQAAVVNQDGILQADSVQTRNGVIELVASDALNLGADSEILARGDDSAAGSAGGTVTLKSDNLFTDRAGSRILVTGGGQGGNGGSVEFSAPNISSLYSSIDASAQSGWNGGTFLLDPLNLILGTSGIATVSANGTVTYNDNSGTDAFGNLFLNVNTAFKNITVNQILLEATGNIYVGNGTANSSSGVFSFSASPGITWNLSTSTGKSGGQMTLVAGNNIIFGNSSKIFDANKWSVTLEAGYDFGNNIVQAGGGNIYLNGGSGLTGAGSIQMAAGSINLIAGESILLASQSSHKNKKVSGSVFTTGGGSIFAYAMGGDIDAGTSNGANSSGSQTSDYSFGISGATPSTTLGGISTKAGGNVTLIAGDNIDSTPVVPSGKWPGASGAYGSGDVTIIAGNQINGNFNLADGVGTLLAGVLVQSGDAAVLQNHGDPNYDSTLTKLETTVMQNQGSKGDVGGSEFAGKSSSPVTLSLIQGSWNVWAAHDIFLQEVNNPNGTFNSLQSYLYNYAADAAANFWAGDKIELSGGTVGTLTGNQKIIFAPRLSLNAGSGGIQVDTSIILAPSSEGSLQIITRDGGDLSGAVTSGSTTLAGITMSDSGSADYTTFGTGHAATPLHLNDPNPNPVVLDITGDINSFALNVPTFAQINVVGDTYNFGFVGRNLHAGDVTSINVGQVAKANMEASGWLNPATDAGLRVGGAITYRGDLTTETLVVTDAQGNPDPISTSLFDSVISGDPMLFGKLRYDASTGVLTYAGVLSSADETFLLNPKDASGNPVAFDAYQLAGWKAQIKALYTASSTASIGDQGLLLSGPGSFNLNARTINLGISGGITVLTPIAVATSVPLTDPLPTALFDSAQSGNPEIAGKLHYDPAAGILTFEGLMTPSELAFLLNPTEVVLDSTGKPVLQPVTLDAAQLSAINKLYADNQKDIIGANLYVKTSGDLTLTASKIANEAYLGGLDLSVGGALDVGGQFTLFGDEKSPKGIFTTSGGHISVDAGGDINVNSSRIAAYNGGNIDVKSRNGDVNAGAGGSGSVTFQALELDPVTYQLIGVPATIPLSGILATTVFGSHAALGDITVSTPNGSINASQGGILQIAFNNADTKNNFVDLTAAHDINATGSGVIGYNINLHAGGDITGLVIGRQSVAIDSQQNVNVTAFSGGNVDISAAGNISGTIISGGSVNASGDSITASLISESITTTGNASGATEGVPQSNVAQNNAQIADNADAAASRNGTQDDDDEKKRKKGITLAQKVGRVTVVLPTKNN